MRASSLRAGGLRHKSNTRHRYHYRVDNTLQSHGSDITAMGPRPQHTTNQSQELLFPRSPRLHISNNHLLKGIAPTHLPPSQRIQILIPNSGQTRKECRRTHPPQSAHTRGNGHIKIKKGLGASNSTSQATPHERNRNVHVRQLAPNLQYHDGVHAVQEPCASSPEHPECVC